MKSKLIFIIIYRRFINFSSSTIVCLGFWCQRPMEVFSRLWGSMKTRTLSFQRRSIVGSATVLAISTRCISSVLIKGRRGMAFLSGTTFSVNHRNLVVAGILGARGDAVTELPRGGWRAGTVRSAAGASFCGAHPLRHALDRGRLSRCVLIFSRIGVCDDSRRPFIAVAVAAGHRCGWVGIIRGAGGWFWWSTDLLAGVHWCGQRIRGSVVQWNLSITTTYWDTSLPSGAHLGGQGPPRWPPEGRNC